MKKISLHYHSFIDALSRIIKTPFEHLLNILILSIVISGLCSVLVINKNINHWQEKSINFPQIIIYFKTTATQTDISLVENTINKFNSKHIKNYQFISKNDGLKELQQDDTLKQIASDVISSNSENPIPDVLVVNTNTSNLSQLQMLKNKIGKLGPVAEVQMDTNYANKLTDLSNCTTQILHFLQIAITILLIIVTYNLIRLQMLLRQDEIIVSRLLGASDSFIMRPLTYYAILQVGLATALGITTVNLLIRNLNSMFLSLNNLFGPGFILLPLNQIDLAQIVAIIMIFSIFAVFLAVRWVFRKSQAA